MSPTKQTDQVSQKVQTWGEGSQKSPKKTTKETMFQLAYQIRKVKIIRSRRTWRSVTETGR